MSKGKTPAQNGVAFVCNRADVQQDFLLANGFSLRLVTCIGQVGAGEILSAFLSGATGVVLIGCKDDECRHIKGPPTARSQVEMSRSLLELLGYDQGQVEYTSNGNDEDLIRRTIQAPRTRSAREQGIESPSLPNFSPVSHFICLDCGRCSGICPVARTGLGFSPRRLIKQALTDQAEPALRTVYACIGCDLCTTVCPSGESITKTVKWLRMIAYNNQVMPVLAHNGLLPTIARIMAKGEQIQNRIDWLKPGLRVTEQGETALFVGCLPYFDVLFADFDVHPITTAQNAVRSMNALGVEPVLLKDERCCGHDLLWLGDTASAINLARHNIEQLKDAGVKRVVFICPECLYTFKVDYPEIVGETGLELVHISQFLSEHGFKPEVKRRGERRIATYHDPCRLGRQLGVYEPPRQLIAAMPEIELREMRHGRSQGLCCGGTSWLECGAAVKLLQERRLAEAKETGADTLVTACPKCEIHLRCAQTKSAERLKIINLVDLLMNENKIER
jgi:Fe-S oxidoreductase